MGGRGCAGWSEGGKWDKCNSIINKIYFLKNKKKRKAGCGKILQHKDEECLPFDFFQELPLESEWGDGTSAFSFA